MPDPVILTFPSGVLDAIVLIGGAIALVLIHMALHLPKLPPDDDPPPTDWPPF